MKFIILFLLVFLASILSAFGAFYLKKASSKFKISFSQIKNSNLIIGLFFYGISTLIFLTALKFGELSIIYPLVSLTYVWVVLLSYFKLGESMNKFKILGVSFIVLGVSVIAYTA